MADRLTDEEIAELEALEKAADAAPWHLVGKPWMADDQYDTYAISGSTDPHGGKAVLQWCEVDEVTLEADDDEGAAWDEAREKQRQNLACAVAARNALPSLLAERRALRAEVAALNAQLLDQCVGEAERFLAFGDKMADAIEKDGKPVTAATIRSAVATSREEIRAALAGVRAGEPKA